MAKLTDEQKRGIYEAFLEEKGDKPAKKSKKKISSRAAWLAAKSAKKKGK